MGMAHSWRADENKRLARLFLKPQASRYLGLVRVAEACLRPITNLFPPRPWDKTRGVEKILVFDPGALGDMLLLAPFLRRLRGSFPTSRIVLAGRGGPADFLQEQGLVDECISVEVPWTKRKTSRLQRNQPISWRWKEFFRSLRQLRKREFDLARSVAAVTRAHQWQQRVVPVVQPVPKAEPGGGCRVMGQCAQLFSGRGVVRNGLRTASELEVDERLLHDRHRREADSEQCSEPAPRERLGPSRRQRQPEASVP